MNGRNTLAGIVRGVVSERMRTVRNLQTLIQSEWRAQARQHLGVSGRSVSEYARAVVPGDATETRFTVELGGTFPNMLEQGMGPSGVGSEGAYDERTFLLKPDTRNVRMGKKGLYLAVPFRRSAAQITALGGPAASSLARGLSPTTSQGGRTSWGESLPQGLLPRGANRTSGIPHTTDLLHGTYRSQGNYSAASPGGQSSYGAFRTISQGAKSWMNPGIKARHIAVRVMAAIPEFLRRMGV